MRQGLFHGESRNNFHTLVVLGEYYSDYDYFDCPYKFNPNTLRSHPCTEPSSGFRVFPRVPWNPSFMQNVIINIALKPGQRL